MITDLNYLHQMTGNDSGMLKTTIEVFLHQLNEMRDDLQMLLNNKNWSELSRLAHKIKSSALMMGIEQMSDDMKELELLARESKNIEKYPYYVARFNTITDLIEEELKMYLDADEE